MQTLDRLIALLPSKAPVLHVLEDAAGIALCLALAYLAYGIAHIICDFLAQTRFFHTFWRWVINILIFVIAGLYALEYSLRSAGIA